MSFGKLKLSRAHFFQIEGKAQLYESNALTASPSNTTSFT